MMARCGHCGAILDPATPECAEHMAQHPPRGSYDERRARRIVRERKRYANPYAEGHTA